MKLRRVGAAFNVADATGETALRGQTMAGPGVLPNSAYSLLTGPLEAVFDLDFVLWNGTSVVERQEFQWLGGSRANASGTLILNTSGGQIS
jgi:hypothetical protein